VKASLISSILLFQIIAISSNRNDIHYGNGNNKGIIYQQLQNNSISTNYSSPETLVLQISPDFEGGMLSIGDKEAHTFQTLVFLPSPINKGSTISCQLSYFQESASLPGGWILNNSNEKIHIPNSANFQKLIVTKKIMQKEIKLELSDNYCIRLLKYFQLDICHKNNYKDFDCYAFMSFIADVKYFPKNPEFEYFKRTPKVGDVVALTNGNKIPESILHWALCLGDNLYLSKFGRSGRGAQAFIESMDLQSMMQLYNCNSVLVAVPKVNARPWDGYNF